MSASPAATSRSLIALAGGTALAALGNSIANVGLPGIGEAFGAPFGQVQWVVLAYLLAHTALVVAAGRLGDLLGARRLLLAGAALFTVASLLAGLAPSLTGLIAARAAQGFGAAIITALSLALAATTVPREQLGRALGLIGATSAIGTALGPAVGGGLLAVGGWRALFLVNVPLGLAVGWSLRRHLPADPIRQAGTERQSFDVTGAALLAVALGAGALGCTLGRGRFGAENVGWLAAAGLAAGLFARQQKRAAAPLIPPVLRGDRALARSLAASLLVAAVVMASLVVGPFYLTRTLGLAPGLTGLALATGPLAAAVAGFASGRIVDRLGPTSAAVAGLLAMTFGSIGLAVLPAAAGLPGYLVPLSTLTAGYALFQTANNTAVLARAGEERRGLVSGLLNLSRNIGLIVGAAVLGALFARITGDVTAADANAVAAGVRAVFAAAAGCSLAALVLVRGGSAK